MLELLISLSVPRYLVEAVRAQREADLVVYWTVEADGRVSLDRIERKDGPALRKTDLFYKAIVEWLKYLRYEPEQLAGKPVKTRMSVPVPFTFAPRRSSPEAEKQEQLDKTRQSPECQVAAANAQEEIRAVAIDSPVNFQAL